MKNERQQAGNGIAGSDFADPIDRPAMPASGPRPETVGRMDPERLLHDLRVHQVELEMQNDELRRTQAALEAARDRYIDLYEKAPVGYVTFGLDGMITEVNQRAMELLGAPRHWIVGRRFADFMPFEDRRSFQQHMKRLFRGEAAEFLQVRVGLSDQSARIALLETAVVPEGAHGGMHCRAALMDVTERVAMREEVDRLAAIVASSEDAIIGRGLDGRVMSWNGAATRLFGVPAEEVLGRTMDRFVPEDRRDEEANLLRRLQVGDNVAHLETERLGRGGVPIHVSVSLFPVVGQDRKVVGSAMIARDISDRRRADRALRQRLRQLDVLSYAGHALIMDQRPVAARRQDIFVRLAEAVGAEIFLDFMIAEERATLLSATGLSDALREAHGELGPADIGPILAGDEPFHVHDMPLQSSRLPLAAALGGCGAKCLAAFPLKAQGRHFGLAVFASISQERFAEADLQVIQTVCDQVSAMLERMCLMDELHERQRSLELADRAKDEFIATLAHELRNPLAPIRNAIAIMRHGERASPEQLGMCRDIIDRQLVQLTRLLEDLLDISRLTRNRIGLRLAPIELTRPIEQAIETTRPLIESRRHELVLDLPAEPIRLEGDLTWLTQVLANVLNNAAKYTDPGGRIVVSARLTGAKEVAVSIIDSGIGIEPQQQQQVFGMFSQLQPAIERSGGGLGIGLSLARGLVELHGGRLEVRSDGLGKGCEFTVYLPVLAEAGSGEASASGAGEAVQPPACRLLVADDNVDAARTLATMLELHGQDVRVAFGGQEAFALAEAWRPQAAVLDIGMEDLNGYELCRKIRAEPWGRSMLLVACTGWGQDDDRDRAHAAGFDIHLVKPVDPNDLLRLLHRWRYPAGAAAEGPP